MPVYEYECSEHGRYEVVQKITDLPLTVCSKCGREVKKVISGTSFALKGGGWYKDGYGSGSKTPKNE